MAERAIRLVDFRAGDELRGCKAGYVALGRLFEHPRTQRAARQIRFHRHRLIGSGGGRKSEIEVTKCSAEDEQDSHDDSGNDFDHRQPLSPTSMRAYYACPHLRMRDFFLSFPRRMGLSSAVPMAGTHTGR